MTVIDFNLIVHFGQNVSMATSKGSANVHRTNSFLTTNRPPTKTRVRQMCSAIPRKLQDKNFFLLRSISLYGFCSDNLSPEPSRHRNLPSSNAAETLPLRYTGECFPNHAGKGKRKSKLENLRRLRTNPNKQSPNAVRRRRLRHSTKPRGLCSGFNNHRFMSVTFSMGKFSQTQSHSQGTHADGLKRLYTHVYPRYRRKSPRCQYSRRPDFRTWCHLHYGSWLPRLCTPFYIYSKPFNFFHESQKQFRLPSSLLSQDRQNNRPSMRPNDNAQWLLCITGLSRSSSSNRLLRHRDKQEVHLSNKQLCIASFNNSFALQVPLADRNLFQMDQAIPANQNIFWQHRERSEDPNLDCYQHLRFDSDCQERTQNQAEFGRNPTNSQHCTFRESSYYTSTYEKYVAERKTPMS